LRNPFKKHSLKIPKTVLEIRLRSKKPFLELLSWIIFGASETLTCWRKTKKTVKNIFEKYI
jgi:hypothetical protein